MCTRLFAVRLQADLQQTLAFATQASITGVGHQPFVLQQAHHLLSGLSDASRLSSPNSTQASGCYEP